MRTIRAFFVLCVAMLATASQAFGQFPIKEDAPAAAKPAAEPKPDKKPSYVAALLLIKADWTKSPAAKEIEAELRAALKDAVIPQEMLDKLPASGPQILFAQGIAGVYQGEPLAQLLSWLKARELIERIEYFEPPVKGPDRDASGRPHMPNFITAVRKPLGFLDLPPLPKLDTEPFVTRRRELTWNLSSPVVGGTYYVKREISVVTKRHGSETETKESNDSHGFSLALNPDQAALINAFPGKEEEMFREAAHRKGFDVVLLIARGDAHAKLDAAEPRLRLPEQVLELKMNYRPGISWPSTRPRRDGGNPLGASGLLGGEPEASPAKSEAPGTNPAGGPPLESNAETLKIFRLKYAKAAALAAILKQLFPTVQLNVAAEERINALVVQGPEEVLMRVEAILLNLDEGPNSDSSPSKKPQDPADPKNGGWRGAGMDFIPASKEALAAKYKVAEQAVSMAAKELREIERARNSGNRSGPKEYQDRVYGKSEAQLQEMRAALRNKVAAAFEARQAMLEAELAEIEARLREVRESLDMRNKISEEIIDRRLGDLLSPERPTEEKTGSNIPKTAVTSPAVPPIATGRDLAVPSVGGGQNLHATPFRADSAGGTQVLGSPETLRKQVEEAENNLRTTLGTVDESMAQLRQSKSDATERDLEQYFPGTLSSIARARQRVQFARDMITGQIRLLTQERDSARLELASAAEEAKLAEALVKAGEAPLTTVVAARQSAQRAQLRLDQSETLLDLYQKIDAPLAPPPTSAAKDSTDEKQATKILADKLGIVLEAASGPAITNTRFRGGLRITEVRPDSPAAREKLQVGDILVGLHVWVTVSLDNVVYALENVTREKGSTADSPRRLKFYVLRNGETLFGHLTLPEE